MTALALTIIPALIVFTVIAMMKGLKVPLLSMLEDLEAVRLADSQSSGCSTLQARQSL